MNWGKCAKRNFRFHLRTKRIISSSATFFFNQEFQPFTFASLYYRWWKMGFASQLKTKKTVVTKWETSGNAKTRTPFAKVLLCHWWYIKGVTHYELLPATCLRKRSIMLKVFSFGKEKRCVSPTCQYSDTHWKSF